MVYVPPPQLVSVPRLEKRQKEPQFVATEEHNKPARGEGTQNLAALTGSQLVRRFYIVDLVKKVEQLSRLLVLQSGRRLLLLPLLLLRPLFQTGSCVSCGRYWSNGIPRLEISKGAFSSSFPLVPYRSFIAHVHNERDSRDSPWFLPLRSFATGSPKFPIKKA